MARALWRPELLLVSVLVLAGCQPSTPEELLEAANRALAEGEPLTAEIHLKNLLQRDPSHVEGRIMLGQVLLATGDAAGAEHNSLTAIELGAEPSRLHLTLLRALLLQRKFAAVVSREAAEPDLAGPDRAVELGLLGAAHRGLGNVEAAERAYRAALAIEPDSLATRTELAALHFQAGRTEEARRGAEEVLAEDPAFVPALLVLGSIQAAAADYDGARTQFERVLSIEAGRRGSASYALALAQLAETHLAQARLDDAERRADELLALTPGAPIALYLKARVEIERGNLESAEARLETLIAATPDYWPAYLLLGVVNASQRQLGQAEMYLRRAANSNPSDTRALLLLTDIYLRQDQIDDARAIVESANPDNRALFLALVGRASLEAGQPELAAEYFASSEQARPGSLQALIDVSSVYIAAGELERAIRVLDNATFEEASSERMANYLLTLIQLRRGNLTAAEATAQRLTDQSPETLNLRGTIAMLGEDYTRARGLFDEALAENPNYVPALLNQARVAVALRADDEAAEYLRRVLAIDPDHVAATLGMVQLAAQRGDFAEAESWLARAPESPLRARLAGDLRFAQQQFDAAADEYAQAFEQQPSADVALRAFVAAKQAGRPRPEQPLLAWSERNPQDPRANFALGTFALENGRLDDAVARYERVLEADSTHVGALNNLAWLYSERGDPRALGLAERALAVLPNDPSVADTLGWIRVRRGEAGLGLPLLEKAAAALPGQPEVNYHYAVALADTGARDRARQVLERVLATGASFPGEAEARALLARLSGDRSP